MNNHRPGASSRLANLIDAAVVTIACAVFLLLTTHQLSLPGLYYDEAWDGVSTMKILQGQPVELDLGAHIDLFGRQWQLMLNSYQGIISTYLLLPFFAIFGPGVESIRAMPIMFGVIALILLYFVAKSWFGRWAALVSVALLAVSPSWVFWSRLGVYVVSEIVPFTLGALLALTIWWRAPRGKSGALWIAFFLLGLGMATKLLYLWPIIALLACLFLLHGRTFWRNRRKGFRALRPAWINGADSNRAIAIALVGALIAFCIGSFTFLAYNWQTGGTINQVRASFFQTDYGANNSTVLPNLWKQLDSFKVVLDGSYFWFQGWAGIPYDNPLMPIAFYATAIGLLLAVALAAPWRPSRSTRPWLLLALALFPWFCMILASFSSPTDRRAILIIPGVLAIVLLLGASVWLTRRGLFHAEAWARPAGLILLAVILISYIAWARNGAPDDQVLHGLDLRLGDLPGIAFWLALIALLILFGWGKAHTRFQRPVVLVIGFLAAILGQSFSTLSGLWPTHLVVMLPIPQIVIAAGIVALPELLNRVAPRVAPQRLTIGVTTLLVATLLASDSNIDYEYHRDLNKAGGYYAFSDGIYDLENYVASQQPRPVAAAEWGIRRQLQILSDGAIEPAEIFQYQFGAAPPTFYEALERTLAQSNTLYLFTAGEIGPYKRFNDFQTYLEQHGMEPVLEHTSRMRDSNPIYLAYGVKRK